MSQTLELLSIPMPGVQLFHPQKVATDDLTGDKRLGQKRREGRI
jgi:hypothetical protein